MAEHPWLILTLRRTGGTSLTGFLGQVSQYPAIEHEPFNKGRVFGPLHEAFETTGDEDALRAAIATALERRPLIKHCIEVVPLALTRILIEEARAAGYRFLVLTRRDEARRLASLLLAISTGAWGPKMAAEIYPRILDGTQVPKPINMDHIEARIRTDFAALGQTLTFLRNRQIDHKWCLFEELYFGETPIETQAREIAAYCGVTVAGDDPRLRAFSEKGGQGSAQIIPFVPNYDAALARLTRLVQP